MNNQVVNKSLGDEEETKCAVKGHRESGKNKLFQGDLQFDKLQTLPLYVFSNIQCCTPNKA